MRVLIVHNEYGKISGEEIVVRALRDVLEENGHHVCSYSRSSAEIMGNFAGTAKAFFTGVYNFSSRYRIRELIKEHQPDLVHVHNLYPLISPSVLGECRRAGKPVVMTVHNYRLVCPNGLNMVRGQVCEKCAGGKEHHCLLNRCEGSLLKSAGYALRGAVARKMRFFRDNVTVYTVFTQFQRRKLIAAGYPDDRIMVVPNMTGEAPSIEPTVGDYVGFAGRLSPEKGMPTLIAAARSLPDVRFKIAGNYDRMRHLLTEAPANVQFLGHLPSEQLPEFYRKARMVVLCSVCYEGFPMMIAEAMLYAKPVVCSRIGGLPEIVDDSGTGFLFTPGNSEELAGRIRRLWDDPALCRTMGEAGRRKAAEQYSRSRYYQRTIEAYHRAADLCRCVAKSQGGKIIPLPR